MNQREDAAFRAQNNYIVWVKTAQQSKFWPWQLQLGTVFMIIKFRSQNVEIRVKSTYFTKYNKHIKSLQSTISNMLVIANKQRTSFTNVENISNTLWNGKNTKYFENVWHSHVAQFLIILVTSTTPMYSRKMPSYTADMISKVQDWTGRIMQMWCHIWIGRMRSWFR